MKILIYCYVLNVVFAENQHNYYWRDYRDAIPSDAISTENLYISQVPYNGMLPATFYGDRKEAVTECFGRRVVVTQGIKLLCDRHSGSFSWEYVNVNNLTEEKLKDYVVGGTEGGTTLYIGKVYHEGEWKIGKVYPPSSNLKGLRVWYNNGNKYVTEDFQILKYEALPIHVIDERVRIQ